MWKTIIVSMSFGGVGLVLYLASSNLSSAVKSHGWDRRINAAYAMARLGFALMVALITEAVYKAPELPVTWRVMLYTLATVLVFIGYLGVAIEQRTSRRPKSGRGGPE